MSMALRSPDELPDLRGMLEREFSRRGLPEDDLAAVMLAAHEAAKNGLRFSDAQRRPVEAAVCFGHDAEVCVQVTDAGAGFEPDALFCAPPLDEDHGRGLCLMQGLMDSVRVERRGALTVVCLRKRLSAPAAEEGDTRHVA
jgi:anti-sigma regulatory factor (Ser/Thr protein kinase)